MLWTIYDQFTEAWIMTSWECGSFNLRWVNEVAAHPFFFVFLTQWEEEKKNKRWEKKRKKNKNKCQKLLKIVFKIAITKSHEEFYLFLTEIFAVLVNVKRKPLWISCHLNVNMYLGARCLHFIKTVRRFPFTKKRSVKVSMGRSHVSKLRIRREDKNL